MLTLRTDELWDTFHEAAEGEIAAAIANKALCITMREDGDEEKAERTARRGVKGTPAEFVGFTTFDPMVGDCVLAVAYDTRTITVS